MEKGRGKGTDTLQTDKVFTRKEYIEREAAKKVICDYCSCVQLCSRNENDCWAIEALQAIPAADVRPVPAGGIGEMSDGYHTFNGLYYQRMVLFAALVKAYKDKAWKSLRHEDGELCFGGGWFIVGIDTPNGSYTYHYEDKDWNRFDCVELPVAKHWDGHTEEDATRLLSLPNVVPVRHGKWETAFLAHEYLGCRPYAHYCSVCHQIIAFRTFYCPNCGARMDGDGE